jgi:hypothetical protein
MDSCKFKALETNPGVTTDLSILHAPDQSTAIAKKLRPFMELERSCTWPQKSAFAPYLKQS